MGDVQALSLQPHTLKRRTVCRSDDQASAPKGQSVVLQRLTQGCRVLLQFSHSGSQPEIFRLKECQQADWRVAFLIKVRLLQTRFQRSRVQHRYLAHGISSSSFYHATQKEKACNWTLQLNPRFNCRLSLDLSSFRLGRKSHALGRQTDAYAAEKRETANRSAIRQPVATAPPLCHFH
jgi:hypothetical protein